MNRKLMLSGSLVVALVMVSAMLAARAPKPAAPQTQARPSRAELVRRGEYLVTIGGCHDCHTPWKPGADGVPGPDLTRALSGHPRQYTIEKAARIEGDRFSWAGVPTNTAFSGPWGVSFAANLTPDKNTGTGIWTFDIFKNTIRNGRHWGVARPLLPPMPWFNYRKMTDEDLLAVYTYTRTLKPIDNEVPQPIPPVAN